MTFHLLRKLEVGPEKEAVAEFEFDRGLTSNERYSLFRGDLSLASPIRFNQTGGDLMADCMRVMRVWLISNRFRDALVQSNATGWETAPAELMGINGAPIAGYHQLIVKGESGELLLDKAQRVIVNKGTRELPYLKGCRIDESDWDQQDIFAPRGQYYVIITELVAEAVLQLNPTGVALMEFKDYQKLDLG